MSLSFPALARKQGQANLAQKGRDYQLSGMFHSSASLAIPNRNNFAAIKAFSPKRGLVFAVNGASATPPPLAPRPPPSLSPGRGFTENPRGGVFQERGGGGEQGCVGEFGGGRGREAPFPKGPKIEKNSRS